MNRVLCALLAAFVALLTSVPAAADLIPLGHRSLEYTLTVEGLDAHPDWVFFVYPTTNSGFAYRLETGKALAGLLMGPRAGDPASRIFAIRAPISKNRWAAQTPCSRSWRRRAESGFSRRGRGDAEMSSRG